MAFFFNFPYHQAMFRILAAVLSFCFIAGCQTTSPMKTETYPNEKHSPDIFEKSVRPVLEQRCVHCHNSKLPQAGLNLQNRELVFKGDAKGPFLVPGKPDESRLWNAIVKPLNHPRVMPGDGWGLNIEERQAFEAWIETGAHWPEGAELKVDIYQVNIKGYL